MEENIKAYISRRKREDIYDKIRRRITKMLPIPIKRDETTVTIVEEQPLLEENQKQEKEEDLASIASETLSDYASSADTEEFTEGPDDPDKRCFRYTLYLITFLFWATCYAIAIELKFGIVYFLFSALFGIYFNTRTSPKKKGEVSAYSVFNENCESIDGTLKAEQFEREIRYGAVSVR